MQNNSENKQFIETIACTVLVVMLLGVIFYLFYYDPVHYVVLIAEDKWAEYGTSVSFAITGVLFLLLSSRPGPYLPRIIWSLIGVVAIFIAGEEISWGQRIFDIETPASIYEHNLQREITLHNLKTFKKVNQRLPAILAYLILIWSFFSVMLSVYMQQQKKMLLAMGVPILLVKLLPMFLLVPFFYLVYPTVKADELGELFLGIAVMMWAIDLFLGHYWDKRPERLTFLSVTGRSLLVVAFMAIFLTYVHSVPVAWRMKITASRDYPIFGMYGQAQVLYDYIYLRYPDYILPNMRKNNAAVLLEAEKQTKGFEWVFIKREWRWKRKERGKKYIYY